MTVYTADSLADRHERRQIAKAFVVYEMERAYCDEVVPFPRRPRPLDPPAPEPITIRSSA